ncbi:MAG TPA: hypothetical protein VFH51_19110, partial [Myxococcota bacterium]|nr:hypothetical protein [Myxococcota bacterium]
GLFLSWMDKITVGYALTPAELHPLQELVKPAMSAWLFNDDNWLTQLRGIDPIGAALLWPILLASSLGWLSGMARQLPGRRSSAHETAFSAPRAPNRNPATL